jgi:two-component system response regulator AtoC
MAEEDETMRLSGSANQELWLVVLGTETQSFRLPEAGALVLGRSSRCDIILPHPSVSREHLRLIVGGGLYIEDLGAVNTTRVSGVPLAPKSRVPIAPGVLVEVGTIGLMVRAGPPPEKSAPFDSVLSVERIAKSSLTVLIQGETGAGKEVMAETIHRLSPRADRPLLRLNCAAISDSLMESELFGYERGAFTGANNAKPGLLETAEGGTIFLDEIGDLGHALQAKLLRVLEERKVWRVGSLKPRTIEVRFLAATHRDLQAAVIEGKFRQDLLFRLNAITLTVPPLRERVQEIETLATDFISDSCRAMGRPPMRIDGRALQAMLRYSWPGNVRELRNAIGRVVATVEGPVILEEHLGLTTGQRPRPASLYPPASVPAPPPPPPPPYAQAYPQQGAYGGHYPHAPPPPPPPPQHYGYPPAAAYPPAPGMPIEESPRPGNLHDDIEALEEDRILRALQACGYNRSKAARMLGIARNTLAARMARFNIKVPEER